MNVLVVVGSDLSINSSANLCHKAYIQGLLDNGCKVDVITAGTDSDKNRLGFAEDANVKIYGYDMQSMYERVGKLLKRGSSPSDKSAAASGNNIQPAQKKGVMHRIKRFILSLYGPYEVYTSWEKQAMKFTSKDEYDVLISISFPPVSHRLAYSLREKGKVTAKRWIQIWEDPWCQDLVFRALKEGKAIKKAEREEGKLLEVADEVLYVSPITLAHQQEIFAKSAGKMTWKPVPSYYSVESECSKDSEIVFGYFGDYSTQIRNLEPFYRAAARKNVHTNICGSSDKMMQSQGKIVVRPRISLEQLRPIEEKTNVLVFLSNLSGGQIPGKIYQYSATNKIILFILDGTEQEKKILKQYFGKFNRYVFCENTAEDISSAIGLIEAGDLGGISNEPLDFFSPVKIVRQILDRTEDDSIE